MTLLQSKPLCLYLIRHGETEWSLSGQYSGRADIPLTRNGEQAARRVGQRLRDVVFTSVLTSPLQRAQQTCVLAGLGPPPEIEADLAEWDNGDDEGRFSTEIAALRPNWNLFRDGCPYGETPGRISNRADHLIARLRRMHGNIALFSHSQFGRVLGARWIGLAVEQAQHFLLSTSSVSVLSYEHEQTDRPAIALWNSAAHELFHQRSDVPAGDTHSLKLRANERWENEGTEVSDRKERT